MRHVLLILSLLATFALAQDPAAPSPTLRNSAYVGGYALTDGAGGWLLGLTAGDDSLLEHFGLRLEADVPLSQSPGSLSLLGTWRTSQGRVDSYTGVGLGVAFSGQGYLMGQFVLGGNFYLSPEWAIFLEGQYRCVLPSGTFSNTAQVVLGLQYRLSRAGSRP